jgi:hypothetical protein
MKKYTTSENHLQAKSNENSKIDSAFILNAVSLGAISNLVEVTFELSDSPARTLSRLHKNLHSLNNQDCEEEAINMLHTIYGLIGSDYADAIILLHKNAEARDSFLYDYIANLGEFLEEYWERRAS